MTETVEISHNSKKALKLDHRSRLWVLNDNISTFRRYRYPLFADMMAKEVETWLSKYTFIRVDYQASFT